MFRARLPINFITSHKIPFLPRYLRLVATSCSLANAMCKKHATRLKCCTCYAKWQCTRSKVCASHDNCNASSENIAKALHQPPNATFGIVQNIPREARQQEVSNLPKWTPFAKLVIGTAIEQSRERIRTVADVNVTSSESEHTLSPQTPKVKRERYACGKRRCCVPSCFWIFWSTLFFSPHFRSIKAILQNLLPNIVTTLPLQHLDAEKRCIHLT